MLKVKVGFEKFVPVDNIVAMMIPAQVEHVVRRAEKQKSFIDLTGKKKRLSAVIINFDDELIFSTFNPLRIAKRVNENY